MACSPTLSYNLPAQRQIELPHPIPFLSFHGVISIFIPQFTNMFSLPCSHPIHKPLHPHLVDTLERWYGLALVLVQGMVDDSTVAEVDLSLRLLLEGQGVLLPVLVVSLWVIFTGVCTTGFLSRGGSFGGLDTRIIMSVYEFSQVNAKQLTRKSTSSSIPKSQPSPSSRSCFGPES
jgi:hypothetical protein